jgi:hypothetical protein
LVIAGEDIDLDADTDEPASGTAATQGDAASPSVQPASV